MHARTTNRRVRIPGVVAAVTGLASWPTAIAQNADLPETTGDTTWWLPENVSPQGDAVLPLFNVILYLTCAVGIGVFVLQIIFLVKYRHRPGRRAIYITGHPKLEVVWTLVPAIILVFVAAFSQTSWSYIKRPPPIPTAGQVKAGEQVLLEVVGMQFKWYFHYPGEDGILGPLNHGKVNIFSQNNDEKIGLNRDHPAAVDDFVTEAMYIPIEKKVIFRLTSTDVLHSFWVPNAYFKQDAVPGLQKLMWLQIDKTSAEVVGTEAGGDPKPFDIVCAELCGQGHYTMRGMLYAVSQAAYEAWSKRRIEEVREDIQYRLSQLNASDD